MVLQLTGCFLALHLADASDLRQPDFFLVARAAPEPGL